MPVFFLRKEKGILSRIPSVSDIKIIFVFLQRDFLDDVVINIYPAVGGTHVVDQPDNGIRVALEFALYIAVVAIPHPAGDAIGADLIHHDPAEAHTLNLAGKNNAISLHD